MNDEDIERARQISIHFLLGIKDNGRRQNIKCVFHKDRSPSLCIYPRDGGYHCFACGAHGKNSIDFLMGLGETFKDAVKQLTNVQ